MPSSSLSVHNKKSWGDIFNLHWKNTYLQSRSAFAHLSAWGGDLRSLWCHGRQGSEHPILHYDGSKLSQSCPSDPKIVSKLSQSDINVVSMLSQSWEVCRVTAGEDQTIRYFTPVGISWTPARQIVLHVDLPSGSASSSAVLGVAQTVAQTVARCAIVPVAQC